MENPGVLSSSRRRWVQGVAGATLLSAFSGQSSGQSLQGEYKLLWGDMHNHNAVGYARGSLERTYDIARSHLDFLAFTPHAQWHDMPLMPNDAHMKWVNGFKVLEEKWPQVQKMAAESNKKDEFVSILAYEWHSSHFGDYCVYYPGDHLPLKYFDDVRTLQEYARGSKTLIIPHHLAYKQGWRGANWNYLDTSVSPVMEIFSEHGLSEHDRAGRPFIRHSNGGRWTRNTLHAALQRGFRAGVIASSDDHLGFPGAYGEGLAGVLAREHTREGILEAVRARRTIAVTGDRIALSAKVNGAWMGSELPFAREREIEVSVRGQDEIERVDILKNNRVIHRYFPEDHVRENAPWPDEALCRLEFGWGPWADLNMERIADWEIAIGVEEGKILDVLPFFQSGPFDEERRDAVLDRTENSCRVRLFTSRRQAFEEAANKGVILHLAGGANAALRLTLTKPSSMSFRKTFRELAQNNEIEFTGRFTTESFVVHRLVTPDVFKVSFRHTDTGRQGVTDWYYARVTQANGHQAWSSPVWVEG